MRINIKPKSINLFFSLRDYKSINLNSWINKLYKLYDDKVKINHWIKVKWWLTLENCYIRKTWIKKNFLFFKIWCQDLKNEFVVVTNKKNQYYIKTLYMQNGVRMFCPVSNIKCSSDNIKKEDKISRSSVSNKINQILKLNNEKDSSIFSVIQILKLINGDSVNICTKSNIIFMFPKFSMYNSETNINLNQHRYSIKLDYSKQDYQYVQYLLKNLNNIQNEEIKINLKKIHQPKLFSEIVEAHHFWFKKNIRTLQHKILDFYSSSFFKNILWKKQNLLPEFELILSKHNIILTNSQKQTISNIFNHICSKKHIHALVLGDVGSGKSIVMLALIYFSIKNNTKILISTPNLILTQQFYEFITLFFDSNIILNTNITKQNKIKITKKLLSSKDIVIGTLSILVSDLPENYKLVLIDEEQKIGVKRKEKGLYSGLSTIFFTATPSPRTMILGLNNYRSLFFLKPRYKYLDYIESRMIDIGLNTEHLSSIINKNILENKKTILLSNNILSSKLKWSTEEIKNWCNIHLYSTKNILNIDGRYTNKENLKTLNIFKTSKVHNLLISTNILSNGLNIKELNTIVVFNSNFFGMLQLHQIRGRLGRFKEKNNFIICYDGKNEKQQQKIDFLLNNTDFLNILEFDIKNRGFGNLLDTEQTGSFKFEFFSQGELIKIAFNHFRDKINRE